MNELERSARIRSYLKIEPISHGQIHVLQMAIPEGENLEIPPERYTILEDSLTAHQSNLIPLIVRRTEAYGELQRYEVVHGSDWLTVAKRLNIERLWVWVFEMTDEQVEISKREMEGLLEGVSIQVSPRINSPILEGEKNRLESFPMVDSKRRLEPFVESIQLSSNFEEKIRVLTTQIQDLSHLILNQYQFQAKLELKIENLTEKLNNLPDFGEDRIQSIERVAPISKKGLGSLRSMTDYRSRTVADLKKLCTQRGIKVKSSHRKDDIINLLLDDDCLQNSD